MTNHTSIYKSNIDFVNNHFWNCYERSENLLVIETVAATDNYLDTYFRENMDKPTNWTNMFQIPQRCLLAVGSGLINCSPMLNDESIIFDYPTFNPLFKMNADYRYVYGISPKNEASGWFDRLIKMDVQKGEIANDWSSPGMYFTEADYLLNANSQVEDDGQLLSIVFNSTSSKSSVAIFNARDLSISQMYDLDIMIPFHAHGVSCYDETCYSNP